MHKSSLSNFIANDAKLFLKHPLFLNYKNPAKILPDKFKIYADILNNVHNYNNCNQGMRHFIEQQLQFNAQNINKNDLNLLNATEQNDVFNVLSMLCHCYRWNYVPAPVEAYALKNLDFPHNLWQPFCYLADILQQPYCGTLYSTTVSNFYLSNYQAHERYDFNQISFDDIHILYNWLPQEYALQLNQWVKIFVMTEMQGGYANVACMDILQAIFNDDVPKLKTALIDLNQGIHKITDVFSKQVRNTTLNIDLWRQVVQPIFIWGLQSDDKYDYPLEGASGLQVGCIQLIDTILGLDMESFMGKSLLKSRMYFPFAMRTFFTNIEQLRYELTNYINNIKINGNNNNNYADYSELKILYNACVESMLAYRKSHVQRGKLYIKGDGTEKQITTTGLSVNSSINAAQEFEKDMQERIQENTKKIITST